MKKCKVWNDINKAYLVNDRYTSILTAIMGKARRLREEWNERIRWGGNYVKNEVSEIDLNCSAIALKSKWKKSIEKAKEGHWVFYSDGSNSKGGEVGGG